MYWIKSRSWRAAVLCLLGASSILPPKSIAGAEDGAEFVGYVSKPQLVARPGGGAFVLAGNATGLYLTALTPLGVREPTWPLGGVRIAEPTNFCTMADSAGGFYLAWILRVNSFGRVKLSRYQGNGVPAAGWPDTGIVVGSSPRSWNPKLCVDKFGAAYVSWYQDEQQSAATVGGFVTRILPDGEQAPGWPNAGTQVSAFNGGSATELVLGAGREGVLACWLAPDFNGFGPFVYATRFLANGTRAPGWPTAGTQLSTRASATSWGNPSICSDGLGGLFAAWVAFPANAAPYAIRFTSLGVKAAGWPTDGLQIAQNHAWAPSIATDAQGGAFLTWESSDWHVRLQHLSDSGFQFFPPGGLQVSALVEPSQGQTAAADGYGGVYITWRTAGPSYGRFTRIDAIGEPSLGWTGDGIPFLNNSTTPALVPAPDGGAIIAQDQYHGPDTLKTMTRRVLPDGSLASVVDVEPSLGAAAPGLTITPLPARDRVALSAGGADVQSVEILDALGRSVCVPTRVTTTSVAAAWELKDAAGSRLSPGLYFVRARTNKGVLTAKLVVAW